MSVTIIGAGHGGVQAAESLRNEGYGGTIRLLEKSRQLPYQRPPLSKDFLKASSDPAPLPLRDDSFYESNDIELHLGKTVTGIDSAALRVHCQDGSTFDSERIVIASGAAARRADCPGHDLDGIHYLRTLEDAEMLHSRVQSGTGRVVVVGAGFIGLEFAALAASQGYEVSVIDFAERPMQRVLSETMSNYFATAHDRAGVQMSFGEGLAQFEGEGGHVSAVRGTSGRLYPCDFAVVGLGVSVDAFTDDSSIITPRGVEVNEYLQTSVGNIFAIGDIAIYPSIRYGRQLRLESVQNASDMGKKVAANIVGNPKPFDPIPWFWSTQGNLRLQIAGLSEGFQETVLRGDIESGRFSLFLFRDDSLVAVESLGSPADHVAARKILETGLLISRAQAEDQNFDLREYAKNGTSAKTGTPRPGLRSV